MFLESFTSSLCYNDTTHTSESNNLIESTITTITDSPNNNNGSQSIVRHFILNILRCNKSSTNTTANKINNIPHHLFIITFNYSPIQVQQLFFRFNNNNFNVPNTNITLFDGSTDRFGWDKEYENKNNTNANNANNNKQSSNSIFTDIISIVDAFHKLESLNKSITDKIKSIRDSDSNARIYILFTGLSSLFLTHPIPSIMRELNTLKSSVHNLSLILHIDTGCVQLFNPIQLQLLQSLSNTHINILSSTMQKLQSSNSDFTGYGINVSINHIRGSGKKSSKTEQWQILNDGLLKAKKPDTNATNTDDNEFTDKPLDENEVKLRTLLAASNAAKAKAKSDNISSEEKELNAAGAPLPAVAANSTFSLGLTEKQRKQRAKLQLPYTQNTATDNVNNSNNIEFNEGGLQIQNNNEDDNVVFDDDEFGSDSEGELDDDLDI